MGMGDKNLTLVCGGKETGLKPRGFVVTVALFCF